MSSLHDEILATMRGRLDDAAEMIVDAIDGYYKAHPLQLGRSPDELDLTEDEWLAIKDQVDYELDAVVRRLELPNGPVAAVHERWKS